MPAVQSAKFAMAARLEQTRSMIFGLVGAWIDPSPQNRAIQATVRSSRWRFLATDPARIEK